MKKTVKKNPKYNDIIEKKSCSRCKRLLPLSAFNQRGHGRLRSECKECQSKDQKENRKKRETEKKMLDNLSVKEVKEIGNKEFLIFDLHINKNVKKSLRSVLETARAEIHRILCVLVTFSKINASLMLTYTMDNQKGKLFEHFVESTPRRIASTKEIPNAISDIFQNICYQIEEKYYEESGLVYQKLKALQLKVVKTKDLKGGKIECSEACLPKDFEGKKWLYCPVGENNDCFFKCARKYVEYFKMPMILDFTDISMPTLVSSMPKFEKHNKIKVNIFILSEKEPKHILAEQIEEEAESFNLEIKKDPNSMEVEEEIIENEIEQNSHIKNLVQNFGRMYQRVYPKFSNRKCEMFDLNLLLHQGHYYLILNINHFFKVRNFKCYNCFNEFRNVIELNKHLFSCREDNAIQYDFIKDSYIKFTSYTKCIESPFIIYCDFETVITPSIVNEQTVNLHVPVMFGSYTLCRNVPQYNKYSSYACENIGELFVKYINSEMERIEKIYNDIIPMKLNKEQEKSFKNATHCFICGCPFDDPLNKKVRDHDHLTGLYRGAAHSKCNLTYLRQKRYVPIVFHNLTNYDAHLFIKNLMNYGEVKLLAKSSEKFFSFTCNFRKIRKNSQLKARFIDSYLFLSDSLSNLAKMNSKFKYSNPEFNFKQFFPYEYAKSYKDLLNPYEPKHEDFYNSLKGTNISKEEFEHAVSMYNNYNCKNLLDYMSIYLKADVMLLTDIFENFRDLSLESYGLDPANYITVPGLAWDACLKMTNQKLDTIQDIETLEFFYKGVRGGICTCSELKYAKSVNRDNFKNKDQQNNQIIYLDANNLYGYCMMQPLPIGDFLFLDSLYSELSLDVIEKRKSELKNKNYILEVDLDYPKELHDKHNEFPLAPEHLNKKLIPNLLNKKNYVVYYPCLKFYLEHGLILKKIHKILEFTESDWLKKWVEINTEKRQKAENEFYKNFYKLMINSVYGKTLENVRKRINLRVTNNNKIGTTLCSKQNYKRFLELDENNHIIELYQTYVIYDKPIYLGMVILELAKLHMYKFHYDIIKPNFDCILMYTDTDSLVYNVKYDKINPEDPKFWNDNIIKYLDFTNTKKPGLFKFEYKNIKSFVCLKSKLYSILINDNNNDIANNVGVPKNIANINLTHYDYIYTLITGNSKSVEYKQIKSYNHNLFTADSKKVCLDNVDEKRIPRHCVSTYAIGHYMTIGDEISEINKINSNYFDNNINNETLEIKLDSDHITYDLISIHD